MSQQIPMEHQDNRPNVPVQQPLLVSNGINLFLILPNAMTSIVERPATNTFTSTNIALEPSSNMLETCRTCLRQIYLDKSTFYEIEADNEQLSTESYRYKLLSIVPEMALNVTQKPVICAECRGSVEALYEFRAKCLKTESIITQYLNAKPDVDVNNFDLKDVLAFNGGDTENTEEQGPPIEHVTVKEELESYDVDESITIVKQEVDNYSSDGVQLDVKEESKTDTFKCEICSKSFKLRYKLRRHMVRHSDERPHKCTICSMRLKDTSSLNYHLKTHFKSHECEVCGKKFARIDGLKHHTTVVHDGMRNYACDKCGKRYTKKCALKKHSCSAAGEKKPYRCKMCGCRFAQKVHLKVHERSHACNVCGKTFKHRQNIRLHMGVHTKELRFSCRICERAFQRKHDVRRHIWNLHKDADAEKSIAEHSIASDVRPETQTERPYNCNICKKSFLLKQYLYKHMMVHTFSCHVCKKMFYKKSTLNLHIRTLHKNDDVGTIAVEHKDTSVVDAIKEEAKEN